MKKQDYIAPEVSVEILMTDNELLSSSEIYNGELNSRQADLSDFDSEIELLINNFN